MHMISYQSDFIASAGDIEKVLADVVRVAKVRNPQNQITGVLFYTHGKFLQVIEGDEAALRRLMMNIEKDNRHSNVEYLVDTPVKTRGFQKWDMDSFNLDSDKKMNADVLKELSESFVRNLLPRSDMLVFYYKTLLARI